MKYMIFLDYSKKKKNFLSNFISRIHFSDIGFLIHEYFFVLSSCIYLYDKFYILIRSRVDVEAGSFLISRIFIKLW